MEQNQEKGSEQIKFDLAKVDEMLSNCTTKTRQLKSSIKKIQAYRSTVYKKLYLSLMDAVENEIQEVDKSINELRKTLITLEVMAGIIFIPLTPSTTQPSTSSAEINPRNPKTALNRTRDAFNSLIFVIKVKLFLVNKPYQLESFANAIERYVRCMSEGVFDPPPDHEFYATVKKLVGGNQDILQELLSFCPNVAMRKGYEMRKSALRAIERQRSMPTLPMETTAQKLVLPLLRPNLLFALAFVDRMFEAFPYPIQPVTYFLDVLDQFETKK